jgi:hypothetical protein
MKKIKITVAALLLSGMSYAQQVANNSVTKKIAYIESVNTIEDMIEWMRSDIDNEVIDQEIGELYVQNMIDLLSRLEDINAGYIFNCENCDEID